MRKILSLLLCAGLLLVALSGCAQDPKPHVPTGDALDDGSGGVTTAPAVMEQSFSLAWYPEMGLNPYTCQDLTNRTLMPLLYQGLFSTDREYRTVPILCRSYTVSPDMKTYTIKLSNARFSDGSAVTTEDVIASYEAAKAGSYYAGRFQHITSITAEAGVLIFELDTPCADLPLLLDIPIVPADQVDAPIPAGSGAYLVDEGISGKRLRRQAGWWCKSDSIVTAAYIPLVEAKSPSQVRDQFEFSDVGLVCADPGSDYYADYRCDYELWDCENGLFLYLGVNAKSTVFENDALRQALTHAIDRNALVENFYRGFAMATTLPASPHFPYYSQKLSERYGYDSMKFVDALANSGQQGAEIIFLVNADDSLRVRVARNITKTLESYGLKVTLTELTSGKFAEHLRWGTYDLYLGQTKLSPNMDPTAFFAPYGSLNYGGMADSALHTLAKEALANGGNYFTLHQMVMEDAQICPLLIRSYAVYARRGLLTKLSPARDNVFFYTTGRTLADAKTD